MKLLLGNDKAAKDAKERIRAAQVRREAGLAKAKIGDERPMGESSLETTDDRESLCGFRVLKKPA